VCVCVCVCVLLSESFGGSGAASNVSSPGVLQSHRASSLVESITSDISAASISHSGLSSTTCFCVALAVELYRDTSL